MAMGLALSAGYVLGRTKKAKLAFGLTTLVLGRKLALNGASVVSFLGSRLGDNPQVKEMREQLRTDLRGVGSAAADALVDRRLEAVADRLHERTLGVQDRLAGLTGRDDGEARAADDKAQGDGGDGDGGDGDGRPARKRAAARTGSRRTGSSTAKSSDRTGGGGKGTGKPAARRTTKRSARTGRAGDGDA
ncbi:DNA primase [Streptomyces sp. NPDC051211]|uniref:DNA primase n=1 Tax=Streptomyces sp. NPDC051211 TaxID=3154643 RepID=UPI00344F9E40